MCGIAGSVDHRQRTQGSVAALDAMLGSIVHRGPDDAGVVVDRELVMGMRRLSIIDLETGAQPFWSEDGRYAMVCNGEIYNYRELQRLLRNRGHRFVSDSDVEVIVHLYEEFGTDCVHHLQGMFGFAVWDRDDRTLFIARDHTGIKPLYYHDAGGRLVFGSEIKSLLAHPEVDTELSPTGLDHYLTHRYVPAPHTMFDGVAVLPPGHSLTCSAGGVEIEQWWDVQYRAGDTASPDRTAESLAPELDRLVTESVEMQLMSDVPFGAFLSGGVDSSLVVALASARLPDRLKTFSVGFQAAGEEAYNELPYARLVADTFGTEHHEIVVTPRDYLSLLPDLSHALDQPIADYVQPSYLALSRFAADHVKMVLTGEGGDELFAGYARYAGHRYSSAARRLPAPVGRLIRSGADRALTARRPKAAIHALTMPTEATQIGSWMPLFDSDHKQAVLHPDLAGAIGDHDPFAIVQQHLDRTDATSALNRFLYVDMKMWLPDYLLARGDKLTMSAALEARVPLLDHRLVEFAASCPVSAKLTGSDRKRLLKDVARKHLPDAVIDRRKTGFSVPFPLWLRNELRPLARDLLSPDLIKKRGFFDHRAVERLLDRHERGEADHATMIYGLMNLELWHQAYLDR